MDDLIDLMVSNESPSEISDRIKDILMQKSAENIDTVRPVVASSIFGDPEDGIDVDSDQTEPTAELETETETETETENEVETEDEVETTAELETEEEPEEEENN